VPPSQPIGRVRKSANDVRADTIVDRRVPPTLQAFPDDRFARMKSVERINDLGRPYFAAALGITVTRADAAPTPTLVLRMSVGSGHLAPHEYVHGGVIILLADTACGYGSFAIQPPEAIGFFTVESKTSHLSAVRSGVLECTARARHVGRSTHVWDAEVVELGSAKLIAMFRCTQLLLYPTGSKDPPA
jgi:uncharacterized protein (TIGR00369 family)